MVLKKAPKKEMEAPVMDIGVAQIKIHNPELQEEPREIDTNDGRTFTAEPNLNTELEVVVDFGDGAYDGVKFYERFKIKQDDDGDWTVRDGTKLGALAKARYGQDFFNSDIEFHEEDFEGFVFQAKIQPKKNLGTGQITGSTVNWEPIMAIPKPKKKSVEPETPVNEEDFVDIPF